MTLQDKAQHALAARDLGDPRWLQVLFGLVLRTGLPPREVELRVEALANGGES